VATNAAAVAVPLVFEGVTVVDVEQGRLLPAQRVVLTGNRIRHVGAVTAVPLPKGARVVDARGKYLIPGLWDMHAHLGEVALSYPLLLANGVTGLRDPWTPIPLDTLVQWRREILAGTRAGPPRQLLTGNTVRGFGELTTEEIAARLAQGANFIKTYVFSYGAAAAARRLGVPFGGHPNSRVPVMEESDSGMRIFDHLAENESPELYRRCVPPQGAVEQCGPVAERFRQNNSWVVPTRGTFAARSAEGEASIMKRVRQATTRFWAEAALASGWLRDTSSAEAAASAATLGTPSAPAGAPVPARPDSLRLLALVRQVNLPLLAGTDWPAHDPATELEMLRGLTLHAELALYVAGGLTPLEALRTATLNPAKLLHGTDSLGTIAPGKLADLVLLDANPLDDITNTTAIQAVVANGHYYERLALDRLLQEVHATAKQGFTVWTTREGLRSGARPHITIPDSLETLNCC